MQPIIFENFSRGMASSPDQKAIRDGYLKYARNVDFHLHPSAVSKAKGAIEQDLDSHFPPDGYESCRVISAGRLAYTKVWVNDIKVNLSKELLILQIHNVPGGDHGLDFLEYEHTVGADDWEYNGHIWTDFEDGDSIGWDKWGSTKAGKIRWNDFNEVLRGACGAFINENEDSVNYNKSDSFPIQIRYVDRYPIDPAHGDVKGFFKDYDSRDLQGNYGKCAAGCQQLYHGRSIPVFTPTMEIVQNANAANPNIFWTDVENGYAESMVAKYLVLAEYDGHQIAPMKANPLGMSNWVGYDSAENQENYNFAVKLRISVPEAAVSGYNMPNRLTAFRVYRAVALLGKSSLGMASPPGFTMLGDYEEIGRVDIMDGLTNVLVKSGEIINETTNEWYMKADIGVQDWASYGTNDEFQDLYKDLFIRIQIDADTFKEYPITSSVMFNEPSVGNTMRIHFTSEAGATFETTPYYFSINSRWKNESGTQAIYIIDNNDPVGDSPPWVVSNLEPEDQPIVECNYGAITFFKGRALVFDVAYDDQKVPMMMRNSNPVNHPYAGFDLFPNYLMPPLRSGDKLKGVINSLDYAIQGSSEKFFKYLISDDGIEALPEMALDLGIESVFSCQELDGSLYFLSKRGSEIGWHVWSPGGKIIDLGVLIRPDLDTILRSVGVDTEEAFGIPLLHENKYLLVIPFVQS